MAQKTWLATHGAINDDVFDLGAATEHFRDDFKFSANILGAAFDRANAPSDVGYAVGYAHISTGGIESTFGKFLAEEFCTGNVVGISHVLIIRLGFRDLFDSCRED